MLKNYLLLPLLLLLAACTNLQTPATLPVTPGHSPKQIHDWTVRGSIVVASEEKSTHARFNWQQRGQNYTIDFFGPLGTYHNQLTGSPGHVTLIDAQNHVFSAPTPEALMQQTLGWHLPVRDLVYWIRGIGKPEPGAWTIQYDDYMVVNGYRLPQTMVLMYPGLLVKIKINTWEI